MDDKVIVIQLDCLMGKDRMAAFRKSLIEQMKDGLVVVPPWAHVAYVGDACMVEIKEEKNSDRIAREVLAELTGMSVNDDINAMHNRLIFGKGNNTLPEGANDGTQTD